MESADEPLSGLIDEYLHLALSGEPPSPSAWLAERSGLDESDRERLRHALEAIAGGHAAEGAGTMPTGDPSRVGPYRLVRQLGRGGQGAVYLAVHTRSSQQVAIKLLHPWIPLLGNHRAHESAVRRMRREAELAARLEHPGICRVHGVDLDGDVPFIAMEYVRGKSLAERIAESKAAGVAPVAWGTREHVDDRVKFLVQLFERVAATLHAAHDAGVVHRDVKPGNIMITPTDEPVVLDFGMALDAEGELAALTATGDVVGSPAYMSPEQIDSGTHTIDRRSDVFSLGVTLYESLSLRRPFTAPTREGLYAAIRTADASDVRSFAPKVPRELVVVLETALEKDPAKRYATASDFADDLRRVRESRPIRARAATPMRRFRRWASRSPTTAASLLLVLFALVAGLSQALWFLHRERQQTNEYRAMYLAASSAAVLEEDPGLALLLGIESVERSPQHAGRTALYRALDELREVRAVRAYQQGSVALRTSPDGRWLATSADLSPDAGLKVWDVGTLGLAHSLPQRGTPHWSPDGSLCLLSGDTATLIETDEWKPVAVLAGTCIGRNPFSANSSIALTGDQGDLLVWECRTPPVLLHRVSPDTEIVTAQLHPFAPALFGISAGGGVYRWDLETGRAEELSSIRPVNTGDCLTVSPDGGLLALVDDEGKLVQLLESDSGAVAASLSTRSAVVGVPVFSPAGTSLFTGHRDGTGTVWDVHSGQRRLEIAGHRSYLDFAQFSAGGDRFVTRGHDRTVRVWNGLNGDELAVLRQAAGFAEAWFDPTTELTYTSGLNGTIRQWQLGTLSDDRALHIPNPTRAVACAQRPTGERFLVGFFDRVRIFEGTTNVVSIDGLELAESAVWSPNGRQVLTSERGSGVAKLWNAETGALESEFAGSGSPLWFATMDPAGTRVLTCPEDGRPRILDAHSGEELGALDGHTGGVRHADFSRDGRWIVTTSEEDRTVRVWNAVEFTCLQVLQSGDVRPTHTTFHPDGKLLVSATWSGITPLWDWLAGRTVRELNGHGGLVTFAQFSPKGDLVLTASRDGLIRLWDTESGERFADLTGHRGDVNYASFGPQGQTIVSCGTDFTVRTWPVDVLTAARTVQPRALWLDERRRYGID
jgi:WD40 repeat protein/serine/threonine protein kinase